VADGAARQAGALVAAISQRRILLPTVFVFLWQARPRKAAYVGL
jgi:hypothetical protein